MKKASAAQTSIAHMHQIPQGQAHTVNIKKYQQYMAYLWSPVVRLERFLDNLEARRLSTKGDGVVE